MREPAGEEAWVDPSWSRLEEQIDLCERQSRQARRAYHQLKIVQLLLAAAIPFLAGFQDNLQNLLPLTWSLLPAVVIGLLGVGVLLVEGIEQLVRNQQRWLRQGAMADALKREKHLFLADAGPYADVEDKRIHLAERIEQLIDGEGLSRNSGRSPARRVV